MNIPDPKFAIGEEVYHITPESPKGYVVEVHYSLRTSMFSYVVTFSAETSSLVYDELELSKTKTF